MQIFFEVCSILTYGVWYNVCCSRCLWNEAIAIKGVYPTAVKFFIDSECGRARASILAYDGGRGEQNGGMGQWRGYADLKG